MAQQCDHPPWLATCLAACPPRGLVHLVPGKPVTLQEVVAHEVSQQESKASIMFLLLGTTLSFVLTQHLAPHERGLPGRHTTLATTLPSSSTMSAS